MTLLDAHCYAVATAVGLSATYCIDPTDQSNVMGWKVHKRIAADDVGIDNVGHAPSPWLADGTHVQWAPGTLEGGTPSRKQELTRHYGSSNTALERVTFLFRTLEILRPNETVLSQFPAKVASKMLLAMNKIDPFWPKFCRHHPLTW